MKKQFKYNPSYQSYIATAKRKRSEMLFRWLKEEYCKYMGIPYHD